MVDDVTLYRTGEREVLFCVNASNIADRPRLDARAPRRGPRAPASSSTRARRRRCSRCRVPRRSRIAAKLLPAGFTPPKLWHFARSARSAGSTSCSRAPATPARTATRSSPTRAGRSRSGTCSATPGASGFRPPGSARATPCAPRPPCPSYGHELDRQHDPLEAGLGALRRLRPRLQRRGGRAARGPTPGRAGASPASCSTAARWRGPAIAIHTPERRRNRDQRNLRTDGRSLDRARLRSGRLGGGGPRARRDPRQGSCRARWSRRPSTAARETRLAPRTDGNRGMAARPRIRDSRRLPLHGVGRVGAGRRRGRAHRHHRLRAVRAERHRVRRAPEAGSQLARG